MEEGLFWNKTKDGQVVQNLNSGSKNKKTLGPYFTKNVKLKIKIRLYSSTVMETTLVEVRSCPALPSSLVMIFSCFKTFFFEMISMRFHLKIDLRFF